MTDFKLILMLCSGVACLAGANTAWAGNCAALAVGPGPATTVVSVGFVWNRDTQDDANSAAIDELRSTGSTYYDGNIKISECGDEHGALAVVDAIGDPGVYWWGYGHGDSQESAEQNALDVCNSETNRAHPEVPCHIRASW